jgi:putative transposase
MGYRIPDPRQRSKAVLTGATAKRVRALIGELCRTWDVEIIRGQVAKDHVHLFVSVPPHLSVSKLMQSLKGRSSRKMLSESTPLSRVFWGRHMWSRGYFLASLKGGVIMQYIEHQGKELEHGAFRIEGELSWAFEPISNATALRR